MWMGGADARRGPVGDPARDCFPPIGMVGRGYAEPSVADCFFSQSLHFVAERGVVVGESSGVLRGIWKAWRVMGKVRLRRGSSGRVWAGEVGWE